MMIECKKPPKILGGVRTNVCKMIKIIKKMSHRLSVIIILFITCCIIFPTIVFMQNVSSYSMERFESMLIKTIQTETSAYAQLLEQEIEAIDQQLQNLLTEDIENRVRVKIKSGKRDMYFSIQIQQIQVYMKSIQNSHELIDSIVLYYPELSRQITISSQKQDETDNETMRKIVNESLEQRIWSDANKIVCWNGKILWKDSDYDDYQAIVAVTISKESMKKYLKKYGTDKDACFSLVRKTEEQDFFASTKAGMEQELLAKELKGYSIQEQSNGEKYLLTCAQMTSDMKLYQMLSFANVQSLLDEHSNMMHMYTVILIGCSMLFIVLFYIMVHKPIEHASRIFQRMGNGELGVQMEKTWYIEFEGMYEQFNQMSKQIQNLIEQEYELRLLNMKAQMKQLQYQISPHFLYNTYFNLCSLLQDEDYECAEQMAELLGRYLKYITVSGDEMVALKEELAHAQSYAEIQKIRFSKVLTIRFHEVSKTAGEILVPRLIVQPLLENAFEHGVRGMLQDGRIEIAVIEKQDEISIMVEDNGQDLTDEKLLALQKLLTGRELIFGESVALLNIHRRLVMQYGGDSGLFITRSQLGGMKCELRLRREEGEKNA